MVPLFTGVDGQLACLGEGQGENERCLHAIAFHEVNHILLLLLEDERKRIPVL